MTNASDDLPLITAMLERLEKQRLPRLLAMKDAVDRGERLGDADLVFLGEVFASAEQARTTIAKHPEYHELVGRIVSLYKEITDKALANEQKA